MQLRQLKIFAAVASTLNFTRAAEQVHLAQSSVSEQIQALEAKLGGALFDRSGRKLRLTEPGRRLQDYAGELLALASEARSAVADAGRLVAGTLTIGSLETLGANHLPPLFAGFHAAHDAITLQLKVARSGELRDGVKSGALDVGFVLGAAPPDAALQSETVAMEDVVVIAPLGHRLSGSDAIHSGDLAQEAFLITESGCVYRRLFERRFPKERPGRPRIAGEFGSIAAIRSLVEAGLGCALVPRSVVSGFEARIAILPLSGEDDTVPITMIWRRRRVPAPTLGLFLEAARDSFKGITPAGVRHRYAAQSPS